MRQMDSGRPAPKRVVKRASPPPRTDVQSSGGNYGTKKAAAYTKRTAAPAPSPRRSQIIAYVSRAHAKPKTSLADIGPGSGYVPPAHHTTVVTPELYRLLTKLSHIDFNPNHLALGRAIDHEWLADEVLIPAARKSNTPGFRGRLPAFPPTNRHFNY